VITFLCCVALLVTAYFTYGKFVEKTFGMDANRPTPAITQADGVDFVPLSTSNFSILQA